MFQTLGQEFPKLREIPPFAEETEHGSVKAKSCVSTAKPLFAKMDTSLMRAFILTIITLIFLPFAAFAQTEGRANTILVLDGSGSMWGQIDGVNKIVIARNVIADLLEDMADEVSLGLTVYGHRERGNCADIQTLVEPAPFTQDRILEAVNAINPRGRTPMADAVVAAAQSLRHTEEPATVILVSDGIENCNPDPCVIAAELEASGVAFTAHVIGFDVAEEAEALAQMQCIADNTGGSFLTADNAAELSQALQQVVQAPVPVLTRIEALVTPQMTPPTRAITWTLLDGTGVPISTGVQGVAIQAELLPGNYVAQAARAEPEGSVTYQTSFTVVEQPGAPVVVSMPAIVETSPITFSARVEPDMSVPASQLNWTLYSAENAVLFGPLAAPGGSVALLPGDYRLEVERVSTGTRHEARFTVEANTPQDVIVPLPALLVDISFVARIGDVGGVTITDPVIWEVTPLDPAPEIAMTNPATLPLGRGAYRVTAYWTVQEQEQSVDFVVVDQPREIVVVFDEPIPQASLTTVSQGIAGSTIEVGWTGPGSDRDWIGFYQPENRSNHAHEAATRVRVIEGNPVDLRLPPLPGTYELRYVRGDRLVLATATVQVLPVDATIEVANGTAGGAADVAWTGPDYQDDWIGFYDPENTENHAHQAYTRVRTSEGNPAQLRYPAEPGTYEVRYVMGLGRTVIARQIVEVTEVGATLVTAPTGTAGALAEVGWTGPGYPGDWIGFLDPSNTENHTFHAATRVNVEEGNPLELRYPAEPGTYELRYVQAQGRQVLARMTVEVTEVSATLTTAPTGTVGEIAEVGWTGPGYPGDWIGFLEPSNDENHTFHALSRVQADTGNPVRLEYPSTPGTYELRYIQAQGRQVLASVTVTVGEAQSGLTLPATAVAGSTIEVGWVGPNAEGDYIGIGRAGSEGSDQWENWTRTSEGNPLRLVVPTEPGTYEVQYFLNQDRVSLTSARIEVTAVEATLTAPSTATAGSLIEIGWTGPNYDRDYIGIGRVGADGSGAWENWTRTSEGNPLQLLVPVQPGEYTISYFLNQDRSVIASVPITVTEVSASITAPQSVIAGSTIEVGWTGPNNEGDYIGIGRVGASGSDTWENWVYTNDGNPSSLVVPVTPGEYVISYFLRQDREIIASSPITVTAVEVSLTAPTSAVAGSTIEVGWTGPNYDSDFIGIGRVGATGGDRWENYSYTRDGNPAQLLVPTTPGEYVIEYFLNQDRTSIATVPISVTSVDATITAPATAAAGSTIEVGWTGPNYDSDFIAIGLVGATGGARWTEYTYTREGSPLTIDVPETPGSYVIQYFLQQDRTVIASVPLSVN